MYTQPESKQYGTAHSRSGTVTFYTLLCFSLAGLIMGFAIGGFASHLAFGSTGHSGPTSSAPMIAGHGSNPSATATPENIFLGVPGVATGDYTSPEIADGTTTYHLSTQIINKDSNTPITVTDVVCRLWLTDDSQATSAGLSNNNYAIPRDPTTFNQPFPSELAGALNFTSPGQQTQPCAANGKTTWNYTLATSLSHGTYYLVVLADWKGVHYNWYMVEIRIHDNHNDGNNGNNNNGNNGGNTNDGNNGNNGNYGGSNDNNGNTTGG